MVKLMLDGFGGDRRKSDHRRNSNDGRFGIACYHVNARLSRNLEDIGELRAQKVLLMLLYCAQAIWCRFRYGVTTMYYIPSPGKRSALIRDWMVMQFCRPFFRKIVLHWHAAGLAWWLETSALMHTRSITYRFLKHVDLSMVLSNFNRSDAEKLLPRRIQVVSNGIPDPCPDFATTVLPRRLARVAARRKLRAGESLTLDDLQNTGGDPHVCHVLYLAHCTRDKGLFDAIEAVTLASRELAGCGSALRLRLVVAGSFVTARDKVEFDRIMMQPESREIINYLGFVANDKKHNALVNADLFCFPTYFSNENQPVNVIEALAYGLPVITTKWRSVPEILPSGYAGLVTPRAPRELATVLLQSLDEHSPQSLRDHFLARFTLDQHLSNLAAALRTVE